MRPKRDHLLKAWTPNSSPSGKVMSSGPTRQVLRNRLAKDANGPSPSKVAHVSARVWVPKVKKPSVVKMIATCLHEDFGYDGDSMSMLLITCPWVLLRLLIYQSPPPWGYDLGVWWGYEVRIEVVDLSKFLEATTLGYDKCTRFRLSLSNSTLSKASEGCMAFEA
jgi:hypothetical protein